MQIKRTLTRSKAASGLAAAALALGMVGTASAADLVDIEIPVDETQLERSLDAAALRADYTAVYKKAERLDVAPKRNAAKTEVVPRELDQKLSQLREDVKEAKRELRAERRAERRERASADESAEAVPEGTSVANGTLEAIAACESGGDPSAVNSAGYYGKYQFDMQTWQSVGGSGNPAAAPESEQDHRAALLYERSGASPWPVCGS